MCDPEERFPKDGVVTGGDPYNSGGKFWKHKEKVDLPERVIQMNGSPKKVW